MRYWKVVDEDFVGVDGGLVYFWDDLGFYVVVVEVCVEEV